MASACSGSGCPIAALPVLSALQNPEASFFFFLVSVGGFCADVQPVSLEGALQVLSVSHCPKATHKAGQHLGAVGLPPKETGVGFAPSSWL